MVRIPYHRTGVLQNTCSMVFSVCACVHAHTKHKGRFSGPTEKLETESVWYMVYTTLPDGPTRIWAINL